MRILVTGATGVVGRRAVPLLVAGNHRVRVIGRSAEKLAAFERLGAETVSADLFDPESLRVAAAGCDAILNLATHMPATSTRMLLPGSWVENDRVRKVGSANLVDAAVRAGVTRFVQESFAPAYPDADDRWIDETVSLAPAGYNRTLLDAEGSASRFSRVGGAGVVLRFGNFYGPDSRFFRDMFGIVRRGWSPVPGSPAGFTSSVSHHDAAAAVVASLDLPAGVYNVVDDEPVTRREYVDTLASALGVKAPRFPPAWTARLLGSAGELLARSQRVSNGKLRGASSWVPKYASVRQGFPAAVSEAEKGAGARVA